MQTATMFLGRFLNLQHVSLKVFNNSEDTSFLLDSQMHADKAGSSGFSFNFADQYGKRIVVTENNVSWHKPEQARWDTDGHYAINSRFDVPEGNVTWDFHTNVDYADNHYSGSAVNHRKDDSNLFLLRGEGAFADSDPIWYASRVCVACSHLEQLNPLALVMSTAGNSPPPTRACSWRARRWGPWLAPSS
jgi:hypothetical protein